MWNNVIKNCNKKHKASHKKPNIGLWKISILWFKISTAAAKKISAKSYFAKDYFLNSNNILLFTEVDFIFDRKTLIAMMQANYADFFLKSFIPLHYFILRKICEKPWTVKTDNILKKSFCSCCGCAAQRQSAGCLRKGGASSVPPVSPFHCTAWSFKAEACTRQL